MKVSFEILSAIENPMDNNFFWFFIYRKRDGDAAGEALGS